MCIRDSLGLIDEHHPDYLAVSFDLKGPTFRKEMFDAYKANRQKTPEELLTQFPLIKEALHTLGIPILEVQGYEADDVIGTVVKKADQAGIHAYIVTGDRDSFQLITDTTNVLLTRKGVSETELYDLSLIHILTIIMGGKTMKLQLALDLSDIDKGLEMVHKTKDYVDVFELGTGFMGACGYDLVKIFRAAFPDIQILADVKTVDGGYSTSKKMFDYGANFATVVGLSLIHI